MHHHGSRGQPRPPDARPCAKGAAARTVAVVHGAEHLTRVAEERVRQHPAVLVDLRDRAREACMPVVVVVGERLAARARARAISRTCGLHPVVRSESDRLDREWRGPSLVIGLAGKVRPSARLAGLGRAVPAPPSLDELVTMRAMRALLAAGAARSHPAAQLRAPLPARPAAPSPTEYSRVWPVMRLRAPRRVAVWHRAVGPP